MLYWIGDFGLKNRIDISEYLKSCDVSYEWHYIDADDDTWNRNIEERNKRIEEGNVGSDFYVDEGLLNKLLSMFEVPDKSEIDVWYELNR
jgi:hypothetical protein